LSDESHSQRKNVILSSVSQGGIGKLSAVPSPWHEFVLVDLL